MILRTVAIGMLVMAALGTPAAAQDGAQNIAGKQYRVEKGDREGTWKVTYGDETFVWEPQRWQPERLQKEGPKFYDIWTKPGLPAQWGEPLEKRHELPGTELHSRAQTNYYFPPYLENYCVEFDAILMAPGGNDRSRVGHECIAVFDLPETRDRLPANERGRVRHKWWLYFIQPRTVQNVGLFATSYYDPTLEDATYLYSPAVRKVRRLASASRQDYIAGFLFRYEDLTYTKPYPGLNYKNTGETKLWTGKTADGRTPFGIGYDDKYLSKIRLDGIGEPVVRLEVTPKESGYWFARQDRWIGLKTFRCYYETTWDSKGQLIRERVSGIEQVPGRPDHEVFWGAEYVEEPGSAYKMVDSSKTIHYNVADFPYSQLNPEMLTREPKSLFWWQ